MQVTEKKFTFNQGQESAIADIGCALREGQTKQLLLGGAGTGKTTTFQEILKNYQYYCDDHHRTGSIAVCAPTNKAVKVAKEMAKKKGISRLEFFTMHSLLGLTVDEKEGKKRLNKRDIDDLGSYEAIIVDEGSMIDDKITDQFFSELMDSCGNLKTNVIGVGDPNQLYPVGLNFCPFFKSFESEDTHELTEVMRQKGSPAGLLVDFCKQQVQRKTKGFDPRRHHEYIKDTDNKGTWYVEGNDFYQYLVKAMAKAQRLGDWDTARFIAFHHKSIEEVNAWLREALYGEPATNEAFLPDEPIICLSPVTRSAWDENRKKITKQIILPTATEGIVRNARETIDTIRIGQEEFSYTVWQVHVDVEDDEVTTTHLLRLLDTNQRRQHKADLEVLRKAAISKEIGWDKFYALKEFVDDCRVAYGLTVYSSQGSTFKNIFVPGNDIMGVRSHDTRNRAWYVATSRASDRIIVC